MGKVIIVQYVEKGSTVKEGDTCCWRKGCREVHEDEQRFSCLLMDGLELSSRVDMKKGILDTSSPRRSSSVTMGGASGKEQGSQRDWSGWHGEGKMGKETENVFGPGL